MILTGNDSVVVGIQALTKSEANLKTTSGCSKPFSAIFLISPGLEILQFLLFLCPVLDYSHDKEIFPDLEFPVTPAFDQLSIK